MSNDLNKLPVLDNHVILKIGTTTMLKRLNGQEVLDQDSFKRIGDQIAELISSGHHVSVISSGAVTAGMEVANYSKRPSGNESMPEVQRLATLGWHRVLQNWQTALDDLTVGGILVTRRELNLDTPEHDEVLRTTYSLLAHGNIPIINENDGITHAELSEDSFGQNDELAAIYAAQMANSKIFGNNIRLLLLSDVDGLYEDINDPSSVIREVTNLSQFEHLAKDSISGHGKGGMTTKFKAATISNHAGVEMWITNGKTNRAVIRTLNGEIGTHFKIS